MKNRFSDIFLDIDSDIEPDFTDYNYHRYEAAVAAHRRRQRLASDAHQAATVGREPDGEHRLWANIRCLLRAIRRRLDRNIEPAEEGYIV